MHNFHLDSVVAMKISKNLFQEEIPRRILNAEESVVCTYYSAIFASQKESTWYSWILAKFSKQFEYSGFFSKFCKNVYNMGLVTMPRMIQVTLPFDNRNYEDMVNW